MTIQTKEPEHVVSGNKDFLYELVPEDLNPTRHRYRQVCVQCACQKFILERHVSTGFNVATRLQHQIYASSRIIFSTFISRDQRKVVYLVPLVCTYRFSWGPRIDSTYCQESNFQVRRFPRASISQTTSDILMVWSRYFFNLCLSQFLTINYVPYIKYLYKMNLHI